jgi:VIT1/CCC1 family predicted Fe2+/Mn2+ transporter
MKTRHVLVALIVALLLIGALLPLAAVFLISIAVLLLPVVPIAGIAVLVALFASAARSTRGGERACPSLPAMSTIRSSGRRGALR